MRTEAAIKIELLEIPHEFFLPKIRIRLRGKICSFPLLIIRFDKVRYEVRFQKFDKARTVTLVLPRILLSHKQRHLRFNRLINKNIQGFAEIEGYSETPCF